MIMLLVWLLLCNIPVILYAIWPTWFYVLLPHFCYYPHGLLVIYTYYWLMLRLFLTFGVIGVFYVILL